jgi:hypothetical protein
VKSDIYKNLLPLINSGSVELLDNSRLISQLCSLERRKARGGRDSIDHGPGQHDDVANAVAGSLVLLTLDDRRALIRQADILVNGAALPLPSISRTVFATLTVDKTGMAAVIYAARTFIGPALLILDFDVQPLSGNLLADIGAKVREFAEQCRARVCHHGPGSNVTTRASDWLAGGGYSCPHQTRGFAIISCRFHGVGGSEIM